MDILLLEKALNTVKTLATLAFIINGLVLVMIAYRFVTKQSMRVE
jgi:hypothetical protein